MYFKQAYRVNSTCSLAFNNGEDISNGENIKVTVNLHFNAN
uniref:Uncharacterized protein n=1 Tax=Anguilla anguilla TaxID=7936 RepID=A0A0E9WU30_ANGAN